MGNGWGFNSSNHTTDWRSLSQSQSWRQRVWADESVVLEQTAESGVFRPFDGWRAGGDGDELRCELSRPKVIWGRNVEGNPIRRDRSTATVTKRETTWLVSRRQSSDTDLLENVSACHMSFYQGHLHTPLTEVSLKSRGPCTHMPLVWGRCR